MTTKYRYKKRNKTKKQRGRFLHYKKRNKTKKQHGGFLHYIVPDRFLPTFLKKSPNKECEMKCKEKCNNSELDDLPSNKFSPPVKPLDTTLQSKGGKNKYKKTYKKKKGSNRQRH